MPSQSRGSYTAFFEHLPIGACLLNADTSIELANSKAQEILGLTQDKLRGRYAFDPRWQLVREDGSPLPRSEVPAVRMLETGIPVENAVLGLRRPSSGELIWLSVNGHLTRADDGSVEYAVVTFTDITAQRQKPQGLDTERHARNVFEQAVVGIAQLSLDGKFLRANQRYCKITGYRSDVLLKMSYRDIAHPEDPDGDPDPINGLVSGEFSEYRKERRILSQDGRSTWVRESIGLVRSEARDEDYALCIIEDITRERELTWELVRSRKMAAINDLVIGLGQRFNNMLAVIIGLTELAKESLDSGDPTYDDLGEILQVGSCARALVAKLLLVTGHERGEKERFKPSDLVRRWISDKEKDLPIGVELELKIDPETCALHANPERFQEVVCVLVENALDALEGGGGAVTVELNSRQLDSDRAERTVLSPGKYAVLTVTDTGVGIRHELLERIFDPFFSTKNNPGAGLGLAVARGIVNSLGGRILVESETGRGSSFAAWLPCDC